MLFCFSLLSGVCGGSASPKYAALLSSIEIARRRVSVQEVTVRNTTDKNFTVALYLVSRTCCIFRRAEEQNFFVPAQTIFTRHIPDGVRLDQLYLKDGAGIQPVSQAWSMYANMTAQADFIIRTSNSGLYVLDSQEIIDL